VLALPLTLTLISLLQKKAYVLKTLRLYDPDILAIEEEAFHCSLYTFDGGSASWERLRVEGPTFLVRRRCVPSYRLMVLNKLEHMNWVCMLYFNITYLFNLASSNTTFLYLCSLLPTLRNIVFPPTLPHHLCRSWMWVTSKM
jgi:hypothetical protein